MTWVMSTGLGEGKVCDPRILYLARQSYTCAGHDKHKTLSSVQGKYSNHVSFQRETLENVFNYEMNPSESLRGKVTV